MKKSIARQRTSSSTNSLMSPLSKKSTMSPVVKKSAPRSKMLKVDGTVEKEDNARANDEENEMYNVIGKQLIAKEYYHGFMPREDCEAVMKNIGDFILRRSSVNGRSAFILSVRVDNGKDQVNMHIRIDFKGGVWSIGKIENIRKASLTALITYYLTYSSHYCVAKGPLLKKGLPRPDYFLFHDNIEVGKELGKGAFGAVHAGILKKNGGEPIEVAIKKMKSDQLAKKNVIEFFKECRLMLRFNHPNIVKVYGIAPGDTPVLIVLELASGGSLKSYFKKNDGTEDIMVKFAKDACKGMHYLQTVKIIHRDLAARNCLLGSKNEVKISDFGLSHAGKELELTKLSNVPVRWLSPETLTKGRFSHKSDVWSYGVLLWEIFAKCASDPFPGKTNKEAKELILNKSHQPLDPLPSMTQLIKDVMKMALTFEEEERPDFTGIMHKLLPDVKV